jgi:hypothetical protein
VSLRVDSQLCPSACANSQLAVSRDGGQIEVAEPCAPEPEGGGHVDPAEAAMAQEQRNAHEWGGYGDSPRPGGQRDHQPKFTTNLNRKFFGMGPKPDQQTEVGHGTRSPRRGGGGTSGLGSRERPLPMLLSPRYAQQMVADGDVPQEWVDEELWKAEPENYFEKMTRIQLREHGKQSAMLARSRAEDRVILSSCFGQVGTLTFRGHFSYWRRCCRREFSDCIRPYLRWCDQNSARLIGVKSSSKQRMTREGGLRPGRHASLRSSPRNVDMAALGVGQSHLPPVTLGAPLQPAVSFTPRPRTRPGGFRVSRATEQAIR